MLVRESTRSGSPTKTPLDLIGGVNLRVKLWKPYTEKLLFNLIHASRSRADCASEELGSRRETERIISQFLSQ